MSKQVFIIKALTSIVNFLCHTINKIVYRLIQALDECCWSYIFLSAICNTRLWMSGLICFQTQK